MQGGAYPMGMGVGLENNTNIDNTHNFNNNSNNFNMNNNSANTMNSYGPYQANTPGERLRMAAANNILK